MYSPKPQTNHVLARSQTSRSRLLADNGAAFPGLCRGDGRHPSTSDLNAARRCTRGNEQTRPRVVIVRTGFADLEVARGLEDTLVEVVMVDRHNWT